MDIKTKTKFFQKYPEKDKKKKIYAITPPSIQISVLTSTKGFDWDFIGGLPAIYCVPLWFMVYSLFIWYICWYHLVNSITWLIIKFWENYVGGIYSTPF